MKNLYLLFFAFAFNVSNAQNPIPNASFETWWMCNPGQPNGWTDSRDVCQVNPACNLGNPDFFSLQGMKHTTPYVSYPAFITSSNDVGIPISTAYTYFHLTYAFNQVSTDKLSINVSVRNASNATIGSGRLDGTPGGCRDVTIPISYTGSGAASVVISVFMTKADGSSTPNVGSYFRLDHLSLDNSSTGIQDIEKESSALRIFPNPATNHIQIDAEMIIADVQITDITGRIVKQISHVDFTGGSFNLQVSDLPAGSYLVALKNDEIMQTKRLVIE
jgi:hypothetical protein